MRNTLRIIGALIVTALGVAVFTTTLVRAVFYAPEATVPDVAAAPAAAHVLPASAGDAPVRMKIPALGIDANVQHVGLGTTGNMAVPTNFTDVGWYRLGPAPGEAGRAVIDGHVDNGLGLPGVFKDLQQIKVGDDIEIDAQDGTVSHFAVTDIEAYPYQAVPDAQIFYAGVASSSLALITCEGTWVQSGRTYDHRLVVYAALRS